MPGSWRLSPDRLLAGGAGLRIDGLLVGTHEDVYRPSDDTLLLAQAVQEHLLSTQAEGPKRRFLEVGTGAGYVAMQAARAGAHAVATDRNPLATRLAAQNARANALQVDVVQTDLLGGLAGPFDLVAFNPPYLPTAPEEVVPGPLNLAFDGGPDGNETVLRFADGLAALAAQPSCVLVVHSSLSDPRPLDDAMTALGYRRTIAARQRLPYEVLTVRAFRR